MYYWRVVLFQEKIKKKLKNKRISELYSDGVVGSRLVSVSTTNSSGFERFESFSQFEKLSIFSSALFLKRYSRCLSRIIYIYKCGYVCVCVFGWNWKIFSFFHVAVATYFYSFEEFFFVCGNFNFLFFRFLFRIFKSSHSRPTVGIFLVAICRVVVVGRRIKKEKRFSLLLLISDFSVRASVNNFPLCFPKVVASQMLVEFH